MCANVKIQCPLTGEACGSPDYCSWPKDEPLNSLYSTHTLDDILPEEVADITTSSDCSLERINTAAEMAEDPSKDNNIRRRATDYALAVSLQRVVYRRDPPA